MLGRVVQFQMTALKETGPESFLSFNSTQQFLTNFLSKMMKKLHPLLFLSNANCIGGKLIEQSGAPYLWSYFVQKKWESEKKRIAHFCHSQVKLNTLINPAWNWKKWTIQFLLIIYWLKYLRCLLSSISHNIFHVISSYINFLINITLHCNA